MLVDYDEFRKKGWDERVRVFGAISSEEKAELVRTHIARWLASHRQELDPSQIEILEENFGDRVFGARIKKTVRFAEAPVKGMSVLKYDPNGQAADSYRRLAKEVLLNG